MVEPLFESLTATFFILIVKLSLSKKIRTYFECPLHLVLYSFSLLNLKFVTLTMGS